MAQKKDTQKTGKISETGHARNVASFEALTAFCKGFGAQYNPVKESITLEKLQSTHQQSLLSLVNLKIDQTALNNATNERQQAFRELKQLGTRLLNALAATGATEETLRNAKSINAKLQGQRARKTQPVLLNGAAEEETKKISVSQQSFDQLIEHFTRLAELLKQQPQYKPNEPDLNNTGVSNKLKQLTDTNTKVTVAYTEWSNSRINRDKVMYDALTGMGAVAADVKKYVKSVFGARSAEYQLISGIEIRRK
jgi:hypothetical protein